MLIGQQTHLNRQTFVRINEKPLYKQIINYFF